MLTTKVLSSLQKCSITVRPFSSGQLYKNSNSVVIDNMQSTHLSQSKSYLKILSIPYFIEGINTPIDASVMETVIKTTYVFNNVCIISKLRVVKVSPKSNMAII